MLGTLKCLEMTVYSVEASKAFDAVCFIISCKLTVTRSRDVVLEEGVTILNVNSVV